MEKRNLFSDTKDIQNLKPYKKYVKKDDFDPIFKTFLSTKKKKELDLALLALDSGLSDLTLGVLFVETSNAQDISSFKDSTIRTSPLSLDKDAEVPKGAAVGDVFLNGVEVLQNYLDKEQPKIPEDVLHQKALEKLLTFLTSSDDHSVLFGGKDSKAEWSVTLAQHLLSKLAVNSDYTIDSYPELTFQGATLCLCENKDKLVGKVGDTSYGCSKGWHGKSDIIIEDLPVSVFYDNDDDDSNDEINTCEVKSDCSDEIVKVAGKFVKRDVQQTLTKTIVFSFLQRKLNEGKLNNYLMPGVAIKSKYLMVCFFDTENDVLLQSKPLELFEGKSVRTLAVLFLWLTLNYKHFCSGITPEMKEKNSDFIRKLGDDLHIYKDEVNRPVHVPQMTQQELYPWAMEPVISDFRNRPHLLYRDVSLNMDNS